MGGNSGRGRRSRGNGSGKREEIQWEDGDSSGNKQRGRRNKPRNGKGGSTRGGYVQSLFVEGGALAAEWQPLSHPPSGNYKRNMFRSVDEVGSSNVDRVQSSPRGGRWQQPKDSPQRLNGSRKVNNAIGYTYPDAGTTAGLPPVGIGHDADFNKPHTSNNCSEEIIPSTSDAEGVPKPHPSHDISPVTALCPSETQVPIFVDRNPSKGSLLDSNNLSPFTVIPPSETQVAVFLDRNPSKGSALGSAMCDKITDILLSEENRMGLGYTVERTEATVMEYLEGSEEQVEAEPTDASKTPNHKNLVKLRNSKQRPPAVGAVNQKPQEVPNQMGMQRGRGTNEMQSKGRKGKNALPNKNKGFLVIGGVRIYTTDVSVSIEDASGTQDLDTEDSAGKLGLSNSERLRQSKVPSTEMSCTSNVSELSDDSEDSEFGTCSDIDDEIAEDYLEGIGGSVSDLLDAEWLLDKGALELVSSEEISENDEEDTVDSESSGCECRDELDDMQTTSSNVNMKNSEKWRSKTTIRNEDSALQREQVRGSILFDEELGSDYGADKGGVSRDRRFGKSDVHDQQSADCHGEIEEGLESLLLSKDSRIPMNRKKDKSPRLPQIWPVNGQKTTYKGVSGLKKKHQKEEIAAKRRERTLRRGVDLEAINSSLERMVLDAMDMFAFQPMHSRDCSQVQRLASIYRLKSGRQGSGKKRFVTVARTKHTCMPSADDKIRLLKLLGRDDEMVETGFRKSSNREKPSGEEIRKDAKMRRAARLAYMRMMHDESFAHEFRKRPFKVAYIHSDTTGGSASKKMGATRSGRRRVTDYAKQPMSFVSCGTMEPDNSIVNTCVSSVSVAEVDCIASQSGSSFERKGSGSASKMGSFEVHTKGFGSRMMAKMGFVEGAGLGKDGQGIVQPLEAVKRPKSLGLGL
eukprot:Gb_03734 [translate_table: standard]